MRILYAHAPGDPQSFGGIQTYARELCAGMRDRGHQVRELRFDPPAQLARGSRRWPSRSYWHPEFLWRGSYYQDFRYHQAVQSRVEGELASFSPDLLHVMHVHQLGALEAGGIPSVVSCHGLELNQSELVRRSLQRANAVHCNSRFTREYLRSLQPGTQEPQVLRWGVRGGSPTGSREAPEFDLVTVSRLVPRKNIESVLRALRRRPELRYAVIGDGPERELLEARASEWKLSGVEFLGELPESEKVSVLRRSRVFVLAPRADLRGDVEGLGLVYYEAFAAGLPVLAARSGGVPEAVGEAGVLVEDPLSVEELEHAMEALLDPAASEHWRERVRDHARGHPWEQFLTEFESFYLRVMDRARSDSR